MRKRGEGGKRQVNDISGRRVILYRAPLYFVAHKQKGPNHPTSFFSNKFNSFSLNASICPIKQVLRFLLVSKFLLLKYRSSFFSRFLLISPSPLSRSAAKRSSIKRGRGPGIREGPFRSEAAEVFYPWISAVDLTLLA